MAAVNAYDKITYGEFKLPSLQELLVAPMYMQQLHNKAEEEFLQNQALAADAATRFQPGIDDAAIQANQQFQSSVQADINDLSKNGLTPGIRRRLIQRKTDFTNNILPLNKAAIDREQWAKAAKEAQLRNPSLIIKDPMQVGLDRWIADPTSHELNPISGQEIYERTRQAMIPISKYISQNLPQLARTGLPFQYFTKAQSGATAEEIAALMGSQYKDIDPNLLSPLANLIKNAADRVVTSTGVYDYYGVDSNEARRVNEYAASAFNHALGAAKVDRISDDFSMRMALEQAKERALDRRAAGKSKNTNLSGLYFADKYGASEDVPQIKELSNIRAAIENDFSKNTLDFLVSLTGNPSAQLALRAYSTNKNLQKLKKYGIDVNENTSVDKVLDLIDAEIDKLGKKYGYTTYDDPDLKKGFINRVIPAITSGSLNVYSSLDDALSGTKALQKNKWFGKDSKDVINTLTNDDSNSFSIEQLDNYGMIRIRDGKDTYYIRPEDIDQSEAGYYDALRKIRGMSDSEYSDLYNHAYNSIIEAQLRGDAESYFKNINYLEFLSSLRDSTIPSRTKTAMLTTGVNKEIQFKAE